MNEIEKLMESIEDFIDAKITRSAHHNPPPPDQLHRQDDRIKTTRLKLVVTLMAWGHELQTDWPANTGESAEIARAERTASIVKLAQEHGMRPSEAFERFVLKTIIEAEVKFYR